MVTVPLQFFWGEEGDIKARKGRKSLSPLISITLWCAFSLSLSPSRSTTSALSENSSLSLCPQKISLCLFSLWQCLSHAGEISARTAFRSVGGLGSYLKPDIFIPFLYSLFFPPSLPFCSITLPFTTISYLMHTPPQCLMHWCFLFPPHLSSLSLSLALSLSLCFSNILCWSFSLSLPLTHMQTNPLSHPLQISGPQHCRSAQFCCPSKHY